MLSYYLISYCSCVLGQACNCHNMAAGTTANAIKNSSEVMLESPSENCFDSYLTES